MLRLPADGAHKCRFVRFVGRGDGSGHIERLWSLGMGPRWTKKNIKHVRRIDVAEGRGSIDGVEWIDSIEQRLKRREPQGPEENKWIIMLNAVQMGDKEVDRCDGGVTKRIISCSE